MGNFSDQMSNRFIILAVNIVKIEKHLCKTNSGRHIYGQLFRAGTSTGANYEEARAGESRADFIHKMQVVLKELRESRYWISLIMEAKLIQAENENLKFLSRESIELANITAKSVVTAKSKSGKPPSQS
ncbi:MAG: four helix bundle protein [Bacteroidales bacterium]|nr:four helix bundle protein [Bacteroidales bacterium]